MVELIKETYFLLFFAKILIKSLRKTKMRTLKSKYSVCVCVCVCVCVVCVVSS